MQNNKWDYIGSIGQIHDIDAKKLVLDVGGKVRFNTVLRQVTTLHNEGKSVVEINKALIFNEDCSNEEREFIINKIVSYFEGEYEFRAVMQDGEDGVQSLPMEQVNVGEHHDVIAIGLYKNLNDGRQEHILDIDLAVIKKWNGLFLGYPYNIKK